MLSFEKVYTVDKSIMKKVAQKLGENLKRLRIERGMSQIVVANILKVDKSYISNIENAKNNPTLATIERLSGALAVSVNELLK